MHVAARILLVGLLFGYTSAPYAQGIIPRDEPYWVDLGGGGGSCLPLGGVDMTFRFGHNFYTHEIACYESFFDPIVLPDEPGEPNFDLFFPVGSPPISDRQQWRMRGRDSSNDSLGRCEGGNPIDLATQNKYQKEVDFVGPGALPLSIVRHYNSIYADAAANKGVFGQGWTANFAERITAIEHPNPSDTPPTFEVVIENETGYRFRITAAEGEPWYTTEGREIHFTWDSQREVFVWIDNGLTKIFLKTGEMYSITHPNGEELTFDYVAGSSPSRIDTITHSSGARLAFTYDASNRVKQILDPANRKYEYFYDASGNLVHMHRPNAPGVVDSKVIYHYEDGSLPNALTGISYADKGWAVGLRYATWTYTGVGFATSSEHGTGVEHFDIETMSPHPTLYRRLTTNARGKQTEYKFAIIAGVPRIIEVEGYADSTCAAANRSYSYDTNGRFDQVTDWQGKVTDYDYNDLGQVESLTMAAGTPDARTTSYEWDPIWNRVTKVTTPLLDTDILLDSAGLPDVITQTNLSTHGIPGQTRVWNFTTVRYPNSHIIKSQTIDGPRTDVNDITTLEYDTNGRLTSVTQQVTAQLSLETTYQNYDVYGRVGKITFPSGLIREFAYHPRGALIEVKDTIGAELRTTRFSYTRAGDLALVTHADGTTEQYIYDGARRLIRVVYDDGDTDPDDTHELRFGYDVASNVTAEEIWEKKLSYVRDPACNPFRPPYPECDYIWQVVHAQKYDRGFAHDSLNRLRTVYYEHRIETFAYNTNNQLEIVRDSQSRTTTLNYNANNDLDTTTYRDGGISELAYDTNGAISGIRDALGQWTYYRRDGFGQVWEIVSPATSNPTYYEYDEAGNLISETDARGTKLNYEYDALNRLENVKVGTSQTPIQTFSYDSDKPGFLRTVTDEAGTHTFTFNQAGELLTKSSVVAGTTLNLSYLYDERSRVQRITYPSGLVVNYHFDSFGEVESVTAQGAGLASSTVVSAVDHYPLGPPAEFTYGNGESRSYKLNKDYVLWRLTSGNHMTRTFSFDANGNIDGFDNRSFAYDNMDRLASHTGPDGNYQYNYDLNGNRNWHKRNGVQTSYGYNTARTRLNSLSGGISESRYYDDNGNTVRIGNRYFDHDDLNRFWRYREGSSSVTYTHNAFGERQIKSDGSTTTRFVYDGPNLLHERAGTIQRDYIYLQGKLVALVRNGVLYYVHTDHLGRPEVVTNSSRSVVWSSENNAFGNNPGIDLIGGLHIGFPGQYYDVESGMYYNYFRTYDSSTGRYLESDAVGLQGGLNTYGYVNGNPLSGIDPLGLDTLVISNGQTYTHGGGNPFGHTAIATTGSGVYSFGNNTTPGSSVLDYLNRELGRRDTTLTIIKTTPEQEREILGYLESLLDKPLTNEFPDYLEDNCAVRTSDALTKAGLPLIRFNPQKGSMRSAEPTLPIGVQNQAEYWKRLLGGESIEVPKNSDLSGVLPKIQQFETD